MNADDFLKKLSVAGGEIVSTGSLTSAEIATAFNDGRMYVDQDHLGYVFLPLRPTAPDRVVIDELAPTNNFSQPN